jgi:ABC-type amino acid transport system permease subunit
MLKDTAIVSAIGVAELMRVSEIQSNYYFRPFEFFTAAAFLYIAMVFAVSQVSTWTERRLAHRLIAR